MTGIHHDWDKLLSWVALFFFFSLCVCGMYFVILRFVLICLIYFILNFVVCKLNLFVCLVFTMCCIVELSLSFFFVLCIILSYLLVIISLRETSGKIIAFFLLSIEKRVRFRKGSGCSKVLCLQLVEEIRMITVILFSLWCKFYKMCEKLLNQFPFTMWLTVDMRFDGLWRVDFVQTTSSSLGTLIEGKFFLCCSLSYHFFN